MRGGLVVMRGLGTRSELEYVSKCGVWHGQCVVVCIFFVFHSHLFVLEIIHLCI